MATTKRRIKPTAAGIRRPAARELRAPASGVSRSSEARHSRSKTVSDHVMTVRDRQVDKALEAATRLAIHLNKAALKELEKY